MVDVMDVLVELTENEVESIQQILHNVVQIEYKTTPRSLVTADDGLFRRGVLSGTVDDFEITDWGLQVMVWFHFYYNDQRSLM